MTLLAILMTLVVALLHVYFLVLEMFLWTTPFGLRTFKNSPDQADLTRVLAANQGLYNGFLAAGLIWSLFLGALGEPVRLFFLTCVVIAGVYGGYSVAKKVFLIQAVPAVIALLLLLATR